MVIISHGNCLKELLRIHIYDVVSLSLAGHILNNVYRILKDSGILDILDVESIVQLYSRHRLCPLHTHNHYVHTHRSWFFIQFSIAVF